MGLFTKLSPSEFLESDVQSSSHVCGDEIMVSGIRQINIFSLNFDATNAIEKLDIRMC